MSQPHVCPVCSGIGKHVGDQGPGDFVALLRRDGPICPACKGACVLWEPETTLKQTIQETADELLGKLKGYESPLKAGIVAPVHSLGEEIRYQHVPDHLSRRPTVHDHPNCGLVPCPHCLEERRV